MERKMGQFTEGLGGLDCSSCLCSGRHGTSYLSHRLGLHLPMEDHHFSVETSTSPGLFCLSWLVWEMGQLLAAPLGLLILCFALWLNQGGLWGVRDGCAKDKLSPVPIFSLQPLDPACTSSPRR